MSDRIHDRISASPTVDHAEPETMPRAGTGPTTAMYISGNVFRRAAGSDLLGGQPIPEPTLGILRRRAGGGEPLPADVTQSVGPLLGTDLTNVRVHADPEAQSLSRSLQATAFTHGTDIYFGAGAYNPGSALGQSVLTHELAHVAQGASGSPGAGPIIGRADDPAEAAADRTANAALGALRRMSAPGPVELDQPAPGAPNFSALRRIHQSRESQTVQRWPEFFTKVPEMLASLSSYLPWNWYETQTEQTPQPVLVGAGKTGPEQGSALTTSSEVGATEIPTLTSAPKTTPLPSHELVEAPSEVGATEIPTLTSAPKTTPLPSHELVEAPSEVGATEIPTPKELFEAALSPLAAPANAEEGNTRMTALRVVLALMTAPQRKSLGEDRDLLAKGRTYVGPIGYMSLVAALDINVKKSGPNGTEVSHHLSGVQADEFIAANIPDYPHLQPYFQQAIAAGKKGDGFVASVGDEDWNAIYGTQFADPIGESEETETNAFTAGKSPDRPAILHKDRGTPSTAIHESMHQYSNTAGVRDTYGSGFNEAFTEYFTRVLTDRNAQPAKLNGPERINYQSNVTFLRGIQRIFGSNKIEQETLMADIYFGGDVAKIKTSFIGAWRAKQPELTDDVLEAKWTLMFAKLKGSKWSEANGLMPPV